MPRSISSSVPKPARPVGQLHQRLRPLTCRGVGVSAPIHQFKSAAKLLPMLKIPIAQQPLYHGQLIRHI
jgi:hypothetical protein